MSDILKEFRKADIVDWIDVIALLILTGVALWCLP
jgi:hypothetical protein